MLKKNIKTMRNWKGQSWRGDLADGHREPSRARRLYPRGISLFLAGSFGLTLRSEQKVVRKRGIKVSRHDELAPEHPQTPARIFFCDGHKPRDRGSAAGCCDLLAYRDTLKQPRKTESWPRACSLFSWPDTRLSLRTKSSWKSTQRKFAVRGQERGFDRLIRDDERNVGFRGTLGDGNDVHAFIPQTVEGAAGDAGRAAHVFTHHGDDSDIGVHRDVIDDLVRQILREFLAQRIECGLRMGLGNDKANVIL